MAYKCGVCRSDMDSFKALSSLINACVNQINESVAVSAPGIIEVNPASHKNAMLVNKVGQYVT